MENVSVNRRSQKRFATSLSLLSEKLKKVGFQPDKTMKFKVSSKGN